MKATIVMCAGFFGWAACGDADGASDADVSTPSDTSVTSDASPDAGDDATPAPPCSTADLADAWTLASVATDGPFLAGYIDLTVTDPDRATAAHGIVPETPGRTILVRVHYPAEAGALGPLTPALLAPPARALGPFPLLVHSHGFSSNKDELSYAAPWLATRGYVVASLEFPLTSLGTLGGPQLLDVVNQPEDVTAVLDDLLARSAGSGDHLRGMIAPERIALSGVSLGGLTTLLATYHRDLHDARVKAAIDLAGPTAFLTPAFYGFVPLPILLVYGDADAIVDYRTHALAARARAPAGTRLLTLRSASHTAFAAAAALFESLDHPDAVGCEAIAGQLPDGQSFLADMADPEVGVTDAAMPDPCTLDPLPYAMRPSRQHLLTRVALFAWLELQLGAHARARAAGCDLLLTTLSAEPDVTLE